MKESFYRRGCTRSNKKKCICGFNTLKEAQEAANALLYEVNNEI